MICQYINKICQYINIVCQNINIICQYINKVCQFINYCECVNCLCFVYCVDSRYR